MVQPDPDPHKKVLIPIPWSVIPDPRAVVLDPTLLIPDATLLIPDPTYLVTTLPKFIIWLCLTLYYLKSELWRIRMNETVYRKA